MRGGSRTVAGVLMVVSARDLMPGEGACIPGAAGRPDHEIYPAGLFCDKQAFCRENVALVMQM
jgi:hypothetical protein